MLGSLRRCLAGWKALPTLREGSDAVGWRLVPFVVVCLGEALIDRLGSTGGDPAVDRPVDDRLGGARQRKCGLWLGPLGHPRGLCRTTRPGRHWRCLFPIVCCLLAWCRHRALLQRDAERPSRIVLVRRARDGERQFQGFDGDQGAGFADQALEPVERPYPRPDGC